MREITLFVKSKREIWLGVEDVPWAIEYMHDQYTLGGIPANNSPCSSDAASSASSSEDVSKSCDNSSTIHWDFAAAAWVATVRSGADSRQRILKPSDVRLSEASAVADVSTLDGLAYGELKEIAGKILQKWSVP